MKRLIFVAASALLISACQSTPPPLPTLGQTAFGSIAELDDQRYLLEQDALFKKVVLAKGISSTIIGESIELNIPGNIAFAINSADMNWNLHDALDKIVLVLKEYHHTYILIVGHTDARGDDMNNQLLSQQRAKTIYDYFIRSEIKPERLSYVGIGSNDLLIEDDITSLDRALNRRLVLKISLKKQED